MKGVGAVQPHQIRASDRKRVSQMTEAIKQKLGKKYQSFQVVNATQQVVAGTNYFYHVQAKPGINKYTVTIFQPLQEQMIPPFVSEVTQGHNALRIGHGK